MKQKLTIGLFLIFIFGILILNVVFSDQELSKSERRKLTMLPKLSTQEFFSGVFPRKLEDYLLDQFPFREEFRSINASSDLFLFNRLESNDIYFNHNHAFKVEKPLDEKQVQYAANKFNEAYEKYLKGMNVYYSIIPEKNIWDDQTIIPKRNHEQLEKIMDDTLTDFKKIDISHLLDLDCYYQTDPHWKQEKIYPIAYELIQQMGAEQEMNAFEDYQFKTLEPFYGVYYGQSALPLSADELKYAISLETQQAQVTGLEFEGTKDVYNESLFEGMDSYDVFLSGAQALLEIELPNAKSNKELIVFRDSFSSSITPYFIGAYKKITLIDLRYIGVDLLEEYINFDNQDVLFLYSTSVLNNGMILK